MPVRHDTIARFLTAVAVSLLTVVLGSPPASGDTAGPTAAECRWLAPVEAPIVDPFRPPPHPFGAGGNRGLEFGTVGSEPVVAVDDGRVTFAGPVGGERWLVITHPSGLRSTYGPLDTIAAVRGQALVAGAVIGSAGPGLHLTARSADRYLDPAPLLDGRCGRARLVVGPTGRAPAGAAGGRAVLRRGRGLAPGVVRSTGVFGRNLQLH